MIYLFRKIIKPNVQLQKGFSLVELSVVLTIIGITLAAGLELATSKTEASRISETYARLDAIENALKVYLVNNQRLPCPATSTSALNINAAGRSILTGTSCTSHDTAYTYTVSSANTVYYSGAVPVKELKLPDKMISDDWDRRFTYVVDRRFVTNSTPAGGLATCQSYYSNPGAQMCFKNTIITSDATNALDTRSITIVDSISGSPSTRVTDAIYALISHGKNGYGAYTYGATTAATRLGTSPDANEVANSPVTASTFPTLVYSSTATTFDDIVRYSNKGTIIEGAGGITDSATCTAAYDKVSGNVSAISTNPCIGLTGTELASCNSLADAVFNFCLQP